MREVLFRGKSVNSGRWLYGDLTFYAGGAQIWEQTEDGKWNYIVNPDTVGQYTGLTDKNGIKIFEGDIVRSGNSLWEIAYLLHYARFAARRPGVVFSVFAYEQGEVVGNIHDDPELLNA